MASDKAGGPSMVDNPLRSVKHAKLNSHTQAEFADSMRFELETDAAPSKSVCSSNRARLALAVLGIAGLCAAIAIALFVASSSSGPSIDVPDAFTAKFTATSRGGAPRQWRGQMHKTTGPDGKWHVQALLTSTANGTLSRITLVNDRGYFATYNASTMQLLTSQCYSAYVPPLGDLTTVFGNAVFSSASDPPALVTTPQCSTRDRFTLQWGPNNVLRSNMFVFCSVADSTFQVGGRNFVADVYDYDPSPASSDTLQLTVPPNVTDGTPLQCSELPPELTAFGNTATQRRLRQSQPPRRLGVVVETVIPAPIPSKSGVPTWPPSAGAVAYNKDCIMVPGLGSDKPTGLSFPSSDHAYWGDLDEVLHTAGCATATFMRFDYQNNGWDSSAHVNTFCELAADGGWVRDKIIISHGAGSLVVTKAFATGVCQKDSSSFWLRIANQLGPSLVADSVGSLCYPSANLFFVQGAAVDAGICKQASPHRATSGIQSLSTNAGSLPGPSSYVTAAGGADAAMCGTTSIGLSMIESVQLFDVQATAMPQYQNDGVVTAVNCIAGTSANLFMASAAYNFYALQANFLDSTCRNGDAFIDPMEWSSPCLWIASGVAGIVSSNTISA